MTAWTPGSLSPRPAAAPAARMLGAQTRAELVMVLRNGEQVLLTLVIPLILLVALSTMTIVDVDGPRVDFFTPGILALAVVSSAFTGQAIATGFDRQYGVLKRLGATPLPRRVLLGAKSLAVLIVELIQLTLIAATGFALGWEPKGNVLLLLLLVLLGTAAFSGLGLLLGGTLRGLTCLAVANVVWFALLLGGGIVFPLSRFGGAEQLLLLLPSAALSEGMRQLLTQGDLELQHLGVLLGWAAGSLLAAARFFRWD